MLSNLSEKDLVMNSGRIPLNPFLINQHREKELLFLIISDLHLDHKKLEKLKGWHKDYNNDLIDYVLILGDFDNLDNKTNTPVDMDKCFQSEARITNLLNFLEFFSCPILIIPGNHDPQTMFESQSANTSDVPAITQHAYNVHKRVYTINKTLSLVGFGGALPGYKDLRGNKTEVWGGFPFSTEEELEQEADAFFKASFEKASSGASSPNQKQEKQQYLLLTHMGPFKSSTTQMKIGNDEKQHIFSGGEYFDKVIEKYASSIVINLHGHTHDSLGRDTLCKIPIVNPGSLVDGNFAKLALTKDQVSLNWVIRSLQFLNLNSY